jgi:nucleoside-diphosphate-sugar epimerase
VGSWFEQLFLTPLFRRRRVVDWGDVVRSHIHVRDCGRALVHLLRHGAVGERYFLVDDEPTSWTGLQVVTARALDVTPRVTRVPVWLVGALMGRIMAECMGTSFRLSNARLKALGFALQYPTIDTGVPALLAHGSACGRAARGLRRSPRAEQRNIPAPES